MNIDVLHIALIVSFLLMCGIALNNSHKLNLKRCRYIVYQVCIVRKEVVGSEVVTIVDTIIRNVQAESEEEAIGTFVKSTENIKVEKRLDIKSFKMEW